MATDSNDPLQLNPNDLLIDSRSRQSGVAWPLPVDMLVETMLTKTREVGEHTSRREIVAALVANAAGMTGAEISEAVRRYRLTRVGELLEVPGGNVVSFERKGPGPRRRGA